MDNYFDWLFSKNNEHPLIIASEAHNKFVDIHPFVDGNGRTARLVMNLSLLQNGYPMAIIPPILRNDYIASIRLANRIRLIKR